jgi:hypothetical protein
LPGEPTEDNIPMHITRFTSLATAAFIAAASTIGPGHAVIAGGGLFHHGYRQVAVTPSGTVSGLTLVPVGTVPAATTTNGLHLIPIASVSSGVSTNQTLQLVPMTAGGVGWSGNPMYLQPATSQSSQVLIPSNSFQATSRRASAYGDGPTDEDLSVLAAGFGNRPSKVDGLRGFLRNEFDAIRKRVGTQLNANEISTLLLGSAKAFLSVNGFGFLMNEPVENALRRTIDQIIREKGATNPDKDAPAEQKRPSSPTGVGVRYRITGTLILGPSAVSPAPAPVPTPPTPRQPEGGSGGGDESEEQPANLIIEGRVEPASPPPGP